MIILYTVAIWDYETNELIDEVVILKYIRQIY